MAEDMQAAALGGGGAASGGGPRLVLRGGLVNPFRNLTAFKDLVKPGIKIIFVSGYAEDAFDKSLPDRKQFNFLPKPFTLKQLVTAVKETMAT